MSKYLNLDGLGTFWTKIKNTFVKSVKITSSGSELKNSDGEVVIPVASEWNSSPSDSVIPSERLVNSSIYKNGENRFVRDGTTDATIGTKGWFKLAEASITENVSYDTITGEWDCNFISYKNVIGSCHLELCFSRTSSTGTLSKRKAIIKCNAYDTLPIDLCVRYNSVDTDATTVPLVVEIWGKLTDIRLGAYLKECAVASNSRYGHKDNYDNWKYYDASNSSSSLGSEKPTASGNFTVVDFVKHYELSSEDGTAIGASNTPVYIGSDGKVKESTYDLSTMVTGPSSATNGAIPLFNGTTGKIIKNSSYTPASFATSGQGLKADSAIQSVKVNGTALTPDENKAVDISVPTASSTTPKMDGNASAGSETKWAKGDHVHPTDTSREAAANKKSTLNASSNTDFPTSQAVATYVGTAISSGTAANANNVNVKKDTTTKLFLTGVEGDPGTSGSNKALKTDTGIYADTTAGQLHATKFDVNGGCTLQYNSTTKSLDFVFA